MDPNVENTHNLKTVICSGQYTDVSHWICHKYSFIDTYCNIYYWSIYDNDDINKEIGTLIDNSNYCSSR
jgi:hypothetical protein